MESASPAPERILIVEDDPAHTELLLRSFEDLPEFAVSLADTISGAARQIIDTPPNLVLTDYLLPDGAGKDLISIMHDRYPVVVMTSHGNEQIAVDLMKAGALDYIVKSPDSFEQMPQVVRRALREWHLRCEHQKALQELAEMNAELEHRVCDEVAKNLEKDRMLAQHARLAAMGEMLRDIAHQWRQPLNNIAVTLQSIVMEQEAGELTDSSCRMQVNRCIEALKYLSHTISEFRTFYQPDRSRQQFDLGEAVAAAIHLVRPSIESHGITLHFNLCKQATVCGFRNEFTNGVMNLLNNACDAVREHHSDNLPCIEVVSRIDGAKALLTVRDNGGGIPADIADKIFDPYFTTKFKSQGTGIGLYMARTIVESGMGGSITARNIGDGAEFLVELPLC